jgi:hypothetical protein
MLSYSVHGLHLVANIEIPGLVCTDPLERSLPSVQVTFGFLLPKLRSQITKASATATPCFCSEVSVTGISGLRIWLIAQKQYFYFKYGDDTEFVIDAAGTKIWAVWPANLTLEDTATYLLGAILGFVLRLRGILCLHASAVEIDGRVALFMGESEAGKSTLAAAFAQQGYTVVSDDVVGVYEKADSFLVQPAYPHIRLWDTSVKALFGQPEALPRIVPTNPTWDKRFLDLTQPGFQFSQAPLPLAAIYSLASRRPETTYPCIEPLPVQQRMLALLANTYIKSLLSPAQRGREFEWLSELVRTVPVQQLTPHTSLALLPKLVEVIVQDFSGHLQQRMGIHASG